MEKFRRRHADLPVNLYRVQYHGCQTALSGNGLQAKETNVTYTEDDMNAFRQSIIDQLTWGHRGDQPYITCFSEKDHAENWACKQPWNHSDYGNESWSLLTIATELMPETCIQPQGLSDSAGPCFTRNGFSTCERRASVPSQDPNDSYRQLGTCS